MVDYSKFDGIADSDEETAEPIELGTTREAGNALFKQKKYAAAIATYSALLDDADADVEDRHVARLRLVDDRLGRGGAGGVEAVRQEGEHARRDR